MNNPLSSILGWLHAGYPDGVPPQDFYPLLALLARTLSDEEVDRIARALIEDNPDGLIRDHDVREAIERVKEAPPNQVDVRDVAARLAAAGWPLGSPDEPPARLGERSPARAGAFGIAAADAPEEDEGDPSAPDGATGPATGSRPGVVQRVVAWLDLGYPDGIPATDRVPILALLRRRLTDDEVDQIAHSLSQRASGDSVLSRDVEAMILDVTQEEPTPQELERVASRLAAKGWPLASE